MKSQESQFSARFLSFDQQSWQQPTSLRQAAEQVRDKQLAAVLIDLLPAADCRGWWRDRGNMNAHESRFTQLLLRELGAERMSFNAWERFLSAARNAATREPVGAAANLLAGADSTLVPYDDWQSTDDAYDLLDKGEEPDRVSAFVTVKAAANRAGIVVWDEVAHDTDSATYETRDRVLASLGISTPGVRSVRVRPTEGQLCLFNSSLRHTLERCSTTRMTMGSFVVHDANGWKLLS